MSQTLNTATALTVPLPAGWTADNDRRWRALFDRIMLVEGGHVADAADRGGETQYGISLRYLKATGSIDADHNGFADLDLTMDTVIDGHDVRALTKDIAYQIYLKNFYVAPGFWNLPRPIDAALFDQAVNGGTTASIKLLQRALNSYGAPLLVVDGGLGTQTRITLTERLGRGCDVLNAIRKAAQARYEAIVAHDPTQQKFLNGWVRRAQELGRA